MQEGPHVTRRQPTNAVRLLGHHTEVMLPRTELAVVKVVPEPATP